MKRAQGLPLNAVIIAVIGIVVLAILIAVVTGFFSSDDGLKGTVSNQCLKAGGECRTANAGSEQGGTLAVVDSSCGEGFELIGPNQGGTWGCSTGQVCCRATFFP